jgi:hypothetical protein
VTTLHRRRQIELDKGTTCPYAGVYDELQGCTLRGTSLQFVATALTDYGLLGVLEK